MNYPEKPDSCENCIHDGVCLASQLNEGCIHFKPKSRFVELPCEVGQTVWFETWKKNATECIGIQPHKVDRIDIVFVCNTKNFIETKIPNWMLGKTVFLSREEAEKALAERSK